jgi:hypothetical protein
MHIRAHYLACMLMGISCWCRGMGMILEQLLPPNEGFAVCCHAGAPQTNIALGTTKVSGVIENDIKNYCIIFYKQLDQLELRINEKPVLTKNLEQATILKLNAIQSQINVVFAQAKEKYKNDFDTFTKISEGMLSLGPLGECSEEVRALYNAVSDFCKTEFGIMSRPLPMEKRLRAQPAHIPTQALTPDVAQQLPPVVKPLSTTPTPPIDAAQQPMNRRQTVRNYLYQKAVAFKNAVWPEKYKLTSLAGFGVGAGAVGVAAYLYYLYPKARK